MFVLIAAPADSHVTPPEQTRPAHRDWLIPLMCAVGLAVVLILTADPAGDRPGWPQGPGLTTDEVLNVEPGLVLFRQLQSYGWGLLDPFSWYEVYKAPAYQHDYPPLGRLILAATHDVMQWIWPVREQAGDRAYYTVQARAASALALAFTVFVLGWSVNRWYGRLAGLCSMGALILMPRVFAHGHIANIESLVGMFLTCTTLMTAGLWPDLLAAWHARARSRWSVPWKPVALTGVLLGLTLLTKIQGVLFPIPFALWAVLQFGRRGITGVAVVGMISASVLFLGWPWLWIDPVANFREYLGQGSRVHLYCWYLGQRYLDSDVPWHYPFVVFATTVPLGLFILGGIGLWICSKDQKRGFSQAREQLILAVILFSLGLFALPSVTVYDGERLFLVAYPLFAVFVGRGATWVAGVSSSVVDVPTLRVSYRTWGLAGLLLAESYTLVTLNPCQLSYYSWLVGGLWGADRLGLEPTYWADSITRSFHEQMVSQLPAGATLHVAPVLHPLQLPGMGLQSPILQRHGIQLASWDDRIRDQVRYVLVYRRHADPWETLQEIDGQPPPGMKRLCELRRDGVQLAVLYELVR